MLAIRLGRVGRKNVKLFRLIVSEKTKSPKRGPLDIIGYYNPQTDPATFEFDKTKLETYLKNGATPSATVARLLSDAGLKGMDKFYDTKKVFQKKTKDPEKLEAMKKTEEESTTAAEAAKAPKEEAPAAEPQTEEKPAEEAPAEETKETPKEETKEEVKEEETKEEPKQAEPAAPTTKEAKSE